MARPPDNNTVDKVAIALAMGAADPPPEGGDSFRFAWEAWGIWANGGFEGMFTNPSAKDVDAFIEALEAVGAPDFGALLRRAAAVLPAEVRGFPSCYEFMSSASPESDEAGRARAQLDREMQRLPQIHGALAKVLQARPELLALADA